MIRKMLFVFLTIMLMVLLAITGVSAEELMDTSGQWWYIQEDDGVMITGYVEEPVGDLVIPGEIDGYAVTRIGDSAFANCMDLTSVTIPESVVSIDVEAFYMCVSLTSVTIPDSVTCIGEWAFKECYDLTSVTIGSNVTSIGDIAFFGCESLTNVIIPTNVSSVGSYAFAHCYSLTSLTIPANVTYIGNSAFFECEELILTVQEGSYAEQYAKDSNIPYVHMLSTTAESTDELLIKQIDEFFTLSKAEIIEKLGSNYIVVPAGPEGACDGYFFEDLGMAFAFYPDSDILELIDCYPNFKIHGVGIGCFFPEIMEALGDAEIIETWLELPIYTVFMVRYHFGNVEYSFIALEEDKPVDILWIHQQMP